LNKQQLKGKSVNHTFRNNFSSKVSSWCNFFGGSKAEPLVLSSHLVRRRVGKGAILFIPVHKTIVICPSHVIYSYRIYVDIVVIVSVRYKYDSYCTTSYLYDCTVFSSILVRSTMNFFTVLR
jgi:hypothetical protein